MRVKVLCVLPLAVRDPCLAGKRGDRSDGGCDSSSSAGSQVGRKLVSASDSLSSETNPIPGVRGVWEIEGRAVESLLRRQDRARTPAKRITVPSAIYSCNQPRHSPNKLNRPLP